MRVNRSGWCRGSAAAVVALLVSMSAQALVLVPTRVRNDAPVAVRIRVTRMVSCVGRDRSEEGPWVTEVILAPGNEGTLPLMGGAAELCVSSVQSIAIESATRADWVPEGQGIPPLLITDQIPDYWSVLHVRVDPQSHQFTLRTVDPAR